MTKKELIHEAARRLASETLSEFWDNYTLPIDLRPIAERLNAVVHYQPLDSKLSGIVVKNYEEDHATIVINSREHPLRRRFTLAHELGHIVERREIAGDKDYSFEEYRGMRYDENEFFADEFAGALLMPEPAINRFNHDDIEAIAKAFNVSIPAARKRVQRLADTSEL